MGELADALIRSTRDEAAEAVTTRHRDFIRQILAGHTVEEAAELAGFDPNNKYDRMFMDVGREMNHP